MIHGKDLMLGNYVEYKIYGKAEWVISPAFNIRYIDYTGILRPIPLTPTILTEWCGFVEGNNKTYGLHYYIRISKHKYILYWPSWYRVAVKDSPFKLFFSSSFGSVEIKYLHELQNNFKANTKQELTVNIPK